LSLSSQQERKHPLLSCSLLFNLQGVATHWEKVYPFSQVGGVAERERGREGERERGREGEREERERENAVLSVPTKLVVTISKELVGLAFNSKFFPAFLSEC
jgi:hypothetical protein